MSQETPLHERSIDSPVVHHNKQLVGKLRIKPRAEIDHVSALIRATSKPGTILNKSGIFVAPECRDILLRNDEYRCRHLGQDLLGFP